MALQVNIAKVLNKKHKVSTSCIAVLTPYSAQKNLIEEKMKEAKLNIKVASIIESQGEVLVLRAHSVVLRKALFEVTAWRVNFMSLILSR